MKQLALILTLVGSVVFGSSSAQSDTVLSYEQFIQMVNSNHPIAVQAKLEGNKAKQYVRRARGYFDPQLSSQFNEKFFQDDPYYSIFSNRISIPTYFGLSAEGGYDMNQGVYLNPENDLPAGGLWSAGLKLTLGQGLFIDKRRAELQKAKLYSNSTLQEQKIMLNQLVLEASQVYWNWFSTHELLQIANEAVVNANTRFQVVKVEALSGNVPNIDTLEAKLQLQNRQIKYQDALLKYQNASQLLQVYLWQDGFIPLEFDSSIVPTPLLQQKAETSLDWITQKDSLINNHPELIQFQNKVGIQEVDLRLKKESLKPQLDLKYNVLSADPDQFWAGAPNNYQAGVQFNFPLFLRTERAEVKLNSLQLEQMKADQALKRASIAFKVEKAINQLQTTSNQWTIALDQYKGYERLLAAENTLFKAGESSLFLVNRRELSYIDSREKLVDAVSSYYMAEVSLRTSLFLQ